MLNRLRLREPGSTGRGRVRPGAVGDERGAFLVLWVLAAVVILLFAALAIDLGNIAQTKQHAQDAADNAAVSAVVDLAPIANGASAPAQEAQAVTDAESYVNTNYTSIPASAWTTCPNNVLPAQVTVSVQTNCIGFFNPADASLNLSDPTGIAVVIPTQTVAYTFGKAGGLKTQGVSALATASLKFQGAGYLLPFGYASGGAGGLQCLKTGSGGKAQGCTGFATGSGQFGVLNSPRFVVLPGTATSGGNDPIIMADIDLGIDHLLTNSATKGASEVCDGTPPPGPTAHCPAYNNSSPYDNANYAVPQTGQTLNDPGPALFNADKNSFSVDSCTISTPRFAHADGFQASNDCNQANSRGENGPALTAADSFGSSLTLNGVQITKYLINGTSSPFWTSCYAGTLPGGGSPDPTAQAIDAQNSANQNEWAAGDACFSNDMAAMNSSSPAIFSSDIINSPRFGVVPVIANGNGSQAQEITGFFGVFLDLAFGTGSKVDAVQAWVFPLNLIQGGTADSAKISAFNGQPPPPNLCSLPANNC